MATGWLDSSRRAKFRPTMVVFVGGISAVWHTLVALVALVDFHVLNFGPRIFWARIPHDSTQSMEISQQMWHRGFRK